MSSAVNTASNVTPSRGRRSGETGAIHVGQDHQPVVLPQRPQRLGGIRKRRPVADRGAERFAFHIIRGNAPGAGELAMHGFQQRPVFHRRSCFLLRRFGRRKRLERRLASDPRASGQRTQRRPQTRLPVDQRAVAIERQDIEIRQPHLTTPVSPHAQARRARPPDCRKCRAPEVRRRPSRWRPARHPRPLRRRR